jgi:hypothetical protein
MLSENDFTVFPKENSIHILMIFFTKWHYKVVFIDGISSVLLSSTTLESMFA